MPLLSFIAFSDLIIGLFGMLSAAVQCIQRVQCMAEHRQAPLFFQPMEVPFSHLAPLPALQPGMQLDVSLDSSGSVPDIRVHEIFLLTDPLSTLLLTCIACDVSRALC